jgi:hypothetical protein
MHDTSEISQTMRYAFQLAWAAGLFEGEGTVRINKPTIRNWGSLMVSVVNTDREVVDFFQARWPGYCKPAGGLDPTRQRPAWVWVIAARKAADFLTTIRPFIVRNKVKERIEHALWFQSQKRHGTGCFDDAYKQEQWEAYMWMCELNWRGVRPDAPRAVA